MSAAKWIEFFLSTSYFNRRVYRILTKGYVLEYTSKQGLLLLIDANKVRDQFQINE